MISIESPQITVSSRTSLLGSKLAVRDSFDDDDMSEDDEVFIQDGRNGLRHDEERGVKRPLMPPRRKAFKSTPFQSNRHRRAVVRALWVPCCYAGFFFAFFLTVGVVVIVINSLMNPSTPWTQQRATALTPPSQVAVMEVWNNTFPRLMSESNLWLQDINNDAVPDIIFGYGTSVDRSSDPGFICPMYFNNQYPCYGGVLALDGKTGQMIWQHWTEEAVTAVECSADITGDDISDCLATGRKGLFCAINGRDGSMVWHMPPSDIVVGGANEVFSPRFMEDVDGDNNQDVIAAHTGTSGVCGHAAGGKPEIQGHLLVINGANGKIIECLPTPGHVESYTKPQMLIWPDGGGILLVGTGGSKTLGGLYAIPMHSSHGIYYTRSKVVYQSAKKGGILVPPLLVDINGDGSEDVVTAMFDSTVLAFDGFSFQQIWNFTLPSSELYSPISAGYYNDDDVPDILVRFHLGPGFPSYHYTQTIVLDGRTGKPLLDKPISGAPSSDSAPSLSLEGHGNDAFLVWSAGCLAHEAAVGGPLPPAAREGGGADWDRCDPKFNSTSSDLKLITQHLLPPGNHIFHTEETPQSQQSKLQTDYAAATTYLDEHPDFWDEYSTLLCSQEPDTPAPVQEPEITRGQEQNEDLYLSMPHQVRKHGRQPHTQQQFSQYQDYDSDSEFMRPQQENALSEQIFRRPGRQVESTNHKTLSTHFSSGIVAPRLQVSDEGLDLIFTSHWSVSKDAALPAFQQCLATELARHKTNSQRFLMNCKRQAQSFVKSCWTQAVQQNGDSSRPFGAARMAQLNVHRVSLQLQCHAIPHAGQRCAGLLPWSLQSLSASPGTNLFHSRMVGIRP